MRALKPLPMITRSLSLSAAFLLLTALFSGSSQASGPSPGTVQADLRSADVIFWHGNIYTGVAGKKSRVQAVAIRRGRIQAAGSDEEIKKFRSKNTRVIDLGGNFAMAGFNDAHAHLAEGGIEKLNVNLVGAKSLPDMLARIKEKARSATPGEWISGGGWDHTLWESQKLPSRADLDGVTGDHPAVFVRVDGHISVANSAALKAGGIAETPGQFNVQADVMGGKVDRDEQGKPTGILREGARNAVEGKIPALSAARRRRALELATGNASAWGITSVQDNSSWDDFLVYEQMEKEGRLTLRITEWLPFNAPVELLKKNRAAHSAKDPLLHTGMLKGFMDGSLGSRTAALRQPYADDPGNQGLPQHQQDELNKMTAERVAEGFQIGFHAIGDAAADMALQAYAYALAQNHESAGNQRFRIEHAQVIDPSQFQRFHDLGVIASMQPNHLLTDMNWAEARIGPERAATSYAWKRFLDSGVRLAFGTDYPVEPITPFRGIYAAITRQNESGGAVYHPEQKLTIEQAIDAYTRGSAYAEFAEKEKGTLAPGMLADLVVLDRDLTRVAAPDILRTRVLRTVVGGKTVYLGK